MSALGAPYLAAAANESEEREKCGRHKECRRRYTLGGSLAGGSAPRAAKRINGKGLIQQINKKEQKRRR